MCMHIMFAYVLVCVWVCMCLCACVWVCTLTCRDKQALYLSLGTTQ